MGRPRSDSGLEKAVCKRLGLRLTKGSGSVHGDGDGKGHSKTHGTWDQLMAECKYSKTPRGSVSFKLSHFDKTDRAARRMGRIPFMASFHPGCDDVYVMLKLSDFERIYRNHLEHTREEDL